MARQLHKLTAKGAEALSKPGRHGDGGGLYLKVLPDGRRAFVFVYRWEGTQKEIGLGAFLRVDSQKGVKYDFTSLAEAREKAAKARAAISEGVDPKKARREVVAIPTFGQLADEVVTEITTAGAKKNAKHLAQWKMTLGDAYCKSIRKKPVNEITTADVLAILKPIWGSKRETASRLRSRIERVLDLAKYRKLISGDNPAAWGGNLEVPLRHIEAPVAKHHSAMPYADVPAFMTALRERDAVSARALEFSVLTAARSGEVFGARWEEIDRAKKVWTVPASRMKAGREHRVPLSDAAIAVLDKMAVFGSLSASFVFGGAKPSRPLSNMAFSMLLRRMSQNVTAHGFRSSFRDWCGDETDFPREVAEAALAHAVGDAAEQAYRRGDALERRRDMMQSWASYCIPAQVEATNH